MLSSLVNPYIISKQINRSLRITFLSKMPSTRKYNAKNIIGYTKVGLTDSLLIKWKDVIPLHKTLHRLV